MRDTATCVTPTATLFHSGTWLAFSSSSQIDPTAPNCVMTVIDAQELSCLPGIRLQGSVIGIVHLHEAFLSDAVTLLPHAARSVLVYCLAVCSIRTQDNQNWAKCSPFRR